jgi:hypothetical protein
VTKKNLTLRLAGPLLVKSIEIIMEALFWVLFGNEGACGGLFGSLKLVTSLKPLRPSKEPQPIR